MRLPTLRRATLKRRTLEDVIVDAVVWIVMIGFSVSIGEGGDDVDVAAGVGSELELNHRAHST